MDPAEPPIRRVGLSAAGAALAGTALGLLGAVATTMIGAHYTSKEHMADRAEAREKERRDALTKTYTDIIIALRTVEGEAAHFSNSQDAATPIGTIVQPVPNELLAALELTGSPRANLAFTQVTSSYFYLRHAPPGPKRVEAGANFIIASESLVDEARTDLGAIPISAAVQPRR